jgi:hypothetical protein
MEAFMDEKIKDFTSLGKAAEAPAMPVEAPVPAREKRACGSRLKTA